MPGMWEPDAKRRGRAYAEKFGKPTLPQLADETGGAIVRYQVWLVVWFRRIQCAGAVPYAPALWFSYKEQLLLQHAALCVARTLQNTTIVLIVLTCAAVECSVSAQVISAKGRLKRAIPASAKQDVTNATLDLLLAARQRLRPVPEKQSCSPRMGALDPFPSRCFGCLMDQFSIDTCDKT